MTNKELKHLMADLTRYGLTKIQVYDIIKDLLEVEEWIKKILKMKLKTK